MMSLTPLQFLLMLAVVTGVFGVGHLVRWLRRIRALRNLARTRGMHFSEVDRFQLGGRVAGRIDVPGAARVRVSDLLYGIEGQNYRYIFCTQYTLGVLHAKRGVRQVATFAEPRDGNVASSTPKLVFAPSSLRLIEQYRHLLDSGPHG